MIPARFDPQLLKFLEGAPLFHQPWWLEAVAPGQWDYVVVKRGEEIAAVMPYVSTVRLGYRFIEGPSKTPYLGPWLRPSTAKYANRLSEEKELMTELIDGLPPQAVFHQNFHPAITNWLPFYWKGFTQTTKYTYRIDDASNLDALWKELRENIRTDIKKARKHVVIEESADISAVIELHKKTCERQGFAFAHSDQEMSRLHIACTEKACCKALIARGPDGRAHAGAYFIWDKSVLYYYTSGADPELRNSGAGSLLIWSGIELASKLGKAFDFEGSMQEPIERVFRAFGGRQISYLEINKLSLPYVAHVRKIIQRAKARFFS